MNYHSKFVADSLHQIFFVQNSMDCSCLISVWMRYNTLYHGSMVSVLNAVIIFSIHTCQNTCTHARSAPVTFSWYSTVICSERDRTLKENWYANRVSLTKSVTHNIYHWIFKYVFTAPFQFTINPRYVISYGDRAISSFCSGSPKIEGLRKGWCLLSTIFVQVVWNWVPADLSGSLDPLLNSHWFHHYVCIAYIQSNIYMLKV